MRVEERHRNGSGRARRAVAVVASVVALAWSASAPLARTVAEDSPEAAAVSHVVTAARVADWGRRSGDAPALILAARMMMQTTLRPGVTDDGAVAEPAGAASLSPTGLLDEAEALSRGDPRTLDEIAEARAAASRGVLNSPFGLGPIVTSKDVQPQQTFGFRIHARGGEILRVAAIGDGDTDIDLTIHDTAGRQICRDGRFDHFPVCTVTPDADGQLRIDIVNRGRVWTKVQIVSN